MTPTLGVPATRHVVSRLGTRRSWTLVLVLALAAPVAGAPPSGHAIFIPLRPEALAIATGANGFVIAGNFFSGGSFHWMPTSGVTDIGGVSISDVSRDGKTIVGTQSDSARLEYAATWTAGGGWRLLPPLRANARSCDALLSSGYGTSDDGRVVVGLGWDGCSYARAFRWEEGSGMTDLGSLTGRSTRANEVSGDGRVVVGWDTGATGQRIGAKWVDGRQELIQGPSGRPVGEAHGTNRDGAVIVGGACDIFMVVPNAWTWTAATGVTCSSVVPPSWAPQKPYQAIMFNTSEDGRVIGGSLSFGLDAESVVWFDGEPFMLRDYLRSHGVPDAFEGWINTGFVTDVSADGRTLVGYAAGRTTFQGFLVILPELDE